MKLTVPAFLQQLGYSPVGQDINGEPSSPNRLYMRPALNSKRWRVLMVTALLLVLLGAGVFFHDHISLPDYPLPKLSGSTATKTSGGKDHGMRTNAEVLEAVTERVDWSRFAYTQYVTHQLPYLCNAVMLFAILDRLGCRAERLMMYPEEWNPDGSSGDEGRLLKLARDKYKVKLQPIKVQAKYGSERKFFHLSTHPSNQRQNP